MVMYPNIHLLVYTSLYKYKRIDSLMNACLKTYLIKWIFRQKAIQIENRPDSYPDNRLFIYPDK